MPPTKPAHGVIATSPATAPDAAPSVVACPVLTFSTISQPSIAAAAATNVFMNACAATSLAASADPALKPNHPNHRIPVPSSVSGSECGGIGSRGQPRRLPSNNTSASAPAPAFTCTTVPPAKSSAPRSASQPPANTQCATGRYTRIDHSAMNHTHALKRRRSAIAPVMSAGVITAKVSWNATNAIVGMEPVVVCATSFRPTKSKLPIQPPFPASPNASEYPKITQRTVTIPIAKKFCMSIASTFLARTMPP